MALGPGTRLGPYVIDAPLGAGGMGEVYKARDSRLNRTVAIKILPDTLSGNAEFRERFEREARLVAALSHPHVCVLHDVGREGATAYLVMEYLEGETLAVCLRRGPLPITEALQIAIAVADALAHAHQRGIIHRDLKPANVMLTARGGVKLLDFGLARSSDAAPVVAGQSLATATEPLTARGEILGTLRYMPPEQLEGRQTDARSDVFAFGVLFYEMLTGAAPFRGESHAALIGAILKDPPTSPSVLRPDTPEVLNHIVTRCLNKDPAQRWQTAADLAAELRWAADAPATREHAAERPSRWRVWPWVVAGALVGAAVVLMSPWTARAPRPVPVALPIAGPADTAVQGIEIAPDGRRLVFAAAAAGRPATLWVSSTGRATPTSIGETDGASLPFWSPDSKNIAFFADGKLKRVAADGGPVTQVCPAPFARGGVWTGHSIVFSAALAMQVVADGGGTPALVPGVPAGSTRWPSMLPDQRHFVYYEGKARNDLGGIFVASLDGGAPVPVLSDAQRAVYVPPGYLVFGRGSALLAQAFDARTLRTSGDPVTLATDLWFDLTALGLVNVSATADGSMLVYRAGGEEQTQLTWYSRDGRVTGTVGEPATHMNVEFSPEANPARLLVSRANPRDGHRAVWIGHLGDNSWTRLSLGPTDDDLNPVWSPDGSEIAFTSTREARTALYRRSAAGGEPRRITGDNKARFARAWSPDGKLLTVDALRIDGSVGTEVLTLADGSSTPVEPANVEAWFGQISPDGKWIAYSASPAGRFEIYVQPLPMTGGKWQISTSGGLEPRWRGDGRELFFVSPDQHIVAVAVDGTSGAMRTTPAVTLFQTRITRADRPDTLNHYDVTPDGHRFLVAVQPLRNGAVAAAISGWAALLPGR